jgi:hypothetical protein
MSFFVPGKWADKRHDGQVPTKDQRVERAAIMKLVTKPAPPFNVDRLFERPVMSPRAAVDDLGLSKADQNSWTTFLGDVVGSANYEPAVRQQVMERLLQEDWDPSLRRVVLQRSVQLFRDMRKAVITVDELAALRKAGPFIGPRGGKWKDAKHTIPWDGASGGNSSRKNGAAKGSANGAPRQNGGPSEKVKELLYLMKPGKVYSFRELKSKVPSLTGFDIAALRESGHLEITGEGEQLGIKLKKSLDPLAYLRLSPKQRVQTFYALEPSGRDLLYAGLRRLQKAGEAKGGLYHRRIPKPGGGYRYIYDEESYKRRKDAHHEGGERKKHAMGQEILRMAQEAGHEGCDMKGMRRLAKKYGRAEVAEHLKGACKKGRLVYKGKRFFLGKGK